MNKDEVPKIEDFEFGVGECVVGFFAEAEIPGDGVDIHIRWFLSPTEAEAIADIPPLRAGVEAMLAKFTEVCGTMKPKPMHAVKCQNPRCTNGRLWEWAHGLDGTAIDQGECPTCHGTGYVNREIEGTP